MRMMLNLRLSVADFVAIALTLAVTSETCFAAMLGLHILHLMVIFMVELF